MNDFLSLLPPGHAIVRLQAGVSAMPHTSALRLHAVPLTTPAVCGLESHAPIRTLAVPVSEEIVEMRVSWIVGELESALNTWATVVYQWIAEPSCCPVQ